MMIQSRPKQSTILSLLMFLILAYGGGIWSALSLPRTSIFWYLVPGTCLFLALTITIKVLWGFQTIEVKGHQWKVKKLMRPQRLFSGKNIEWWKETEIKTAGGLYKQLHIHVQADINVKVSLQEHTNYSKLLKTVKSKYPNKEVSPL